MESQVLWEILQKLAAVENQDMKVESVMGNYLCLELAFEEG